MANDIVSSKLAEVRGLLSRELGSGCWAIDDLQEVECELARRQTRDEVVNELMARLDADVSSPNFTDYCIGEAHVRALFERYRRNEPF